MRRLLSTSLAVALLASLLAGCVPPKAEMDALRAENANLRAENAALRNELQALRQPKPSPELPAAPEPVLDPAVRAKLERMGIKVKDTGDTVTLILPNKVLFASGSATLRSAAKRALDQSASVITTYLSNGTVVVEGHTDSQPIRHSSRKWKSNQQLSVARANAVAKHLRAAGVNPANITVRGYGPSRPVASNKTRQGRALNRRVEIFIKLGS
jgi:flagellar motor protein MotB